MEEIKKAKDLYERQKYHKSKDYAEEGLGIVRGKEQREEEAQACLVLAWSYYMIKDYKKSKSYCDQLQNIAKEVGDKKLEGEGYQFLACYFYRVRDYKKGTENGIKSLSIAEEFGNEEMKDRALRVLTKLHQEYGNQSPDIVIGLGDSELEGGARRTIPPHSRGTTREVEQDMSDEECDNQLNDVVEMGADEQKRGACEFPALSFYFKQGENNALEPGPGEIQEWPDFDDHNHHELSSNPNEQSLSTAHEIEGTDCQIGNREIRPGYHPGTEYDYEMTAPLRGIALIINIASFASDQWQSRIGSDKDVRDAKKLFTGLAFTVRTLENLSKTELLNEVHAISKEDHSAYNCFVLLLMSHGKSGVVVCSDDETLPIQSILDELANCHTLLGKPKLLFIQACRGELEDVGVPFRASNLVSQAEVDSPIGKEREPETRVPTYADFLVASSTVDDYVSYRRDVDGSYYVRCLVEVFQERVSYDHLNDMLTIVNNSVSNMEALRQSTTENEYRLCKQIPEVRHTLRKKVRF